jgi:ketosteroid isomerase-like protein
MTTHPNAQLLQEAYKALSQGDLQPLLSMLSEDITWTDSTLGPLAGTYTGKDEVPQFFGKMMNVYDGTLDVDIADIVASDDHAIVLTRESGTAHGEPVAWTSVHVYSFADGRCHRFVSYGSAEYQRFWAGKQAGYSS